MATDQSDAGSGEAPEPRLFLVRLEGRAQPAYAVCERTAIVERPAEGANLAGGSLYQRLDDFFRDESKAARALPAIAIPAELDPKGGGYVVTASSMHDGHNTNFTDGDEPRLT